MKRSNEHLVMDDGNKKPRFTASPYVDAYTQYSMMQQQQYQFNPSSVGYAYNTPLYYPQIPSQQPYATAYAPPYAPAFTPPNVSTFQFQETPRTIYLGNVTADMQPADILSQIHCGALENYRAVPEKSCAFLTFIDPASAQLFLQQFSQSKLIVNNVELKLGWGKAIPIHPTLQTQLMNGATRNVYLGKLDKSDTEESIRAIVSPYGEIESIKVLPDKQIAFVHFLTMSAAIKCVTGLSTDPSWTNKKANFGKDHCAGGSDVYPSATAHIQRTLYLGNIQADATLEEICNALRGGNIVQIKYIKEKHICFVTYIDPAIALNVLNHIEKYVVTVKQRRLRVGWGKANTIPAQVAIAIQNGATRNVYIGGIGETTTVEKLRQDFAQYGEIELVNIHKDKNCAFVNFTNVQYAINAVAGMKQNPDYNNYKLNYGKDRCGNPWKITTKTAVKKKEPKVEQEKVAELTEENLRAFNLKKQ